MNINPLNIITLPKVAQNNVSFYGAKNLNFTSRDIFTKETDELSTLEKVEILHKLQLAPEKRQEVILQSDRYIDTFITAMKYGANSDVAKTFAQYSRKDLREANQLLDDEAEINNIPDIIKLKGREKQKAHILAKKKFDTLYTSTIAQQKDKVFIRTLELIKLGVCDGYILKIASLDEQNYQKVKEYLKLGLEDYQAFQLIRENKYYAQMLEKLIKEGVPYCNASACLGSDVFEKLTKRGYSKAMCAILTISNSPNMPDERKIELTQSLTSQIEKNSIKTKKFVEEMTSLIQGIKDDEFEDFVEYISKIDFKSIKQLAPHMIRYSSEEIIDFIQWHYRNKTKEFNENTLNIEGGLSRYLSNNSLNSKQLNELLTTHPLTRREVGEIPKTWLNRRKDKNKATKEIYDAIKTFQGNKDTWGFSQELSKILKKKRANMQDCMALRVCSFLHFLPSPGLEDIPLPSPRGEGGGQAVG